MPSSRTTRLTIALVALIAAAISVVSWPLAIYGTDPIAIREESRSILLHGELHVDPNVHPSLARPGKYFALNARNGLYYSKYGLFGSIASMPPLVAERLVSGQLPAFNGPHRVVYLNLWNTVLTALLAALLTHIAFLYTDRPLHAAAYVLLCLFSTFCWNYLRAQSTEVVQLVLSAAAYDGVIRYLRSGRRVSVVVAWCALGALVLTRATFLTLIPVVALAIALHHRGRRPLVWALPPLVIGLLLATVNAVKFGSPFLTGYEQWTPERHQPSWHLAEGLWGYFLSVQWSVWWCFPLTLFALVGVPGFWRKHRFDALLLAGGAGATVLLLAGIPSWAGEWCYGPRYLLFGLPLVSLPLLTLADGLAGQFPRRRSLALALLVIGTPMLAWSTYLQVQFNRLEYFAFYRLKIPLEHTGDAYHAKPYFTGTPVGQIHADLLHSNGDFDQTPWAAAAREDFTPTELNTYRRTVRIEFERRNLWWFDKPAHFGNARGDD